MFGTTTFSSILGAYVMSSGPILPLLGLTTSPKQRKRIVASLIFFLGILLVVLMPVLSVLFGNTLGYTFLRGRFCSGRRGLRGSMSRQS